jgi:aryl-alcohol dehydrogenase-like predicted oxidoreductase
MATVTDILVQQARDHSRVYLERVVEQRLETLYDYLHLVPTVRTDADKVRFSTEMVEELLDLVRAEMIRLENYP